MTAPPEKEFDALFRQWYRPLLAQAMFVSGGRRTLADDAVQEAFLQCWRRWNSPHLEPVRTWPPWLRTTVVNMTQAQIAQEVGISQMHVSRLLTRTLARLREKLLVEE